jgi:hypothetical protein
MRMIENFIGNPVKLLISAVAIFWGMKMYVGYFDKRAAQKKED